MGINSFLACPCCVNRNKHASLYKKVAFAEGRSPEAWAGFEVLYARTTDDLYRVPLHQKSSITLHADRPVWTSIIGTRAVYTRVRY